MGFTNYIDEVMSSTLTESVGEIAGKEYKFSKQDSTLKFFNNFVFLFHEVFDDIQYKLKHKIEVNTSKFKQEHVLFTTYGITEEGHVIIKGRVVLPVGDIFKTADWEYITSPRNFHKLEAVYTSEKDYDTAEDAFKTIKKNAVPYAEWRKHNSAN